MIDSCFLIIMKCGELYALCKIFRRKYIRNRKSYFLWDKIFWVYTNEEETLSSLVFDFLKFIQVLEFSFTPFSSVETSVLSLPHYVKYQFFLLKRFSKTLFYLTFVNKLLQELASVIFFQICDIVFFSSSLHKKFVNTAVKMLKVMLFFRRNCVQKIKLHWRVVGLLSPGIFKHFFVGVCVKTFFSAFLLKFILWKLLHLILKNTFLVKSCRIQ